MKIIFFCQNVCSILGYSNTFSLLQPFHLIIYLKMTPYQTLVLILPEADFCTLPKTFLIWLATATAKVKAGEAWTTPNL